MVSSEAETNQDKAQEKVFALKDGGQQLSLRNQFKLNGRSRNLYEKILAATDHSV